MEILNTTVFNTEDVKHYLDQIKDHLPSGKVVRIRYINKTYQDRWARVVLNRYTSSQPVEIGLLHPNRWEESSPLIALAMAADGNNAPERLGKDLARTFQCHIRALNKHEFQHRTIRTAQKADKETCNTVAIIKLHKQLEFAQGSLESHHKHKLLAEQEAERRAKKIEETEARIKKLTAKLARREGQVQS